MTETTTTTTTIPAGWKLVPIEPTHEMMQAAHKPVGNALYDNPFMDTSKGWGERGAEVYRAMLCAAPSPAPAAPSAAQPSRLQRALNDPDGWCPKCGCGHDGVGLAHLETCPAAPGAQPAQPDAMPLGYIPIPQGLHPDTADLVCDFAAGLAEKLRASEVKYGWDTNWKRLNWRDELAAELLRHVHKGDPIDVAAYCAFAWHHGWSVTPAQGGSVSEAATVAMVIPYTDEDDRPDMPEWRMISIGRPGDIPDHVLDRIPAKAAGIICEAINAASLSAARASAPAATEGVDILRNMTALFEMTDEANEPGTDSYTVLKQAQEVLRSAGEEANG